MPSPHLTVSEPTFTVIMRVFIWEGDEDEVATGTPPWTSSTGKSGPWRRHRAAHLRPCCLLQAQGCLLRGKELLPFSSTFGGAVLWVLGNVRLGHCGGKRKARLASRGRMREQAEEQIYSPWRGHVFRNAHDLRTSHGGLAPGTPGPRLPDHRVGSAVAGILASTPAPAIPNRATDLKGTGAS